LLLNVGPRSDGTIPDEVQRVLLDVGAWLSINGEAIYGTRPWRTYGEGPTKVAAGSFHDTDTAKYTAEDFRFTTKGDGIYAIGLVWPTSGEAVIRSLARTVGSELVQSVALVGGDAKLRFEQSADGLHVQLPAESSSKYAYALRVTFDRASR
jgi:alpha-L-fucosidase